jgi:hypothetical protein
MKYIQLDFKTYLANPDYWNNISNDNGIALHIGPNNDEN